MSKFTADLDERTSWVLEDLSRGAGVPRADVARRALTLFERAVEAREPGQRLAITDSQDRVLEELVP